MSQIRISELRNKSVLRVYSERKVIQADPDYQRMGEVWNLEKRQLLMDTILNDFDMPKLYFHEFTSPKTLDDGRAVRYAVIDGRQRLETTWQFIDGEFALADDFAFFSNSQVQAGGLTYRDLASDYPELKILIDSYNLPVTSVLTDDIELIEEMFLRLNEAVPLNAAEKRNAIGGPMARVIREVANHEFFKAKIPFSNRRYQHREVAAKFLLLTTLNSIGDTKKSYLDEMVRSFKRPDGTTESQAVAADVTKVLDKAAVLFVTKDKLLRTQAMSVIYYLVLKESLDDGWADEVTRHQLVEFDDLREKNRREAEHDIAQANYDLLEFDRMHLQGSNDRSSIRFRWHTLSNFLKNRN